MSTPQQKLRHAALLLGQCWFHRISQRPSDLLGQVPVSDRTYFCLSPPFLRGREQWQAKVLLIYFFKRGKIRCVTFELSPLCNMISLPQGGKGMRSYGNGCFWTQIIQDLQWCYWIRITDHNIHVRVCFWHCWVAFSFFFSANTSHKHHTGNFIIHGFGPCLDTNSDFSLTNTS